jgi:hypothetical protein
MAAAGTQNNMNASTMAQAFQAREQLWHGTEDGSDLGWLLRLTRARREHEKLVEEAQKAIEKAERESDPVSHATKNVYEPIKALNKLDDDVRRARSTASAARARPFDLSAYMDFKPSARGRPRIALAKALIEDGDFDGAARALIPKRGLSGDWWNMKHEERKAIRRLGNIVREEGNRRIKAISHHNKAISKAIEPLARKVHKTLKNPDIQEFLMNPRVMEQMQGDETYKFLSECQALDWSKERIAEELRDRPDIDFHTLNQAATRIHYEKSQPVIAARNVYDLAQKRLETVQELEQASKNVSKGEVTNQSMAGDQPDNMVSLALQEQINSSDPELTRNKKVFARQMDRWTDAGEMERLLNTVSSPEFNITAVRNNMLVKLDNRESAERYFESRESLAKPFRKAGYAIEDTIKPRVKQGKAFLKKGFNDVVSKFSSKPEDQVDYNGPQPG